MLTENGKKMIVYGIMNSSRKGTIQPGILTGFSLKSPNGATNSVSTSQQTMASFINALNEMTTSSSASATYIKCGTGTTAATEGDYKLESETTGLNCDSAVTAVGSNYSKTYTAIFSNTTDTDIVVTEIGLFMCAAYIGNNNGDFLIDRIVLTTPITIPAGESKAITYELGF